MDILSINLGAKKALEKLGVKVEKTNTVLLPETTVEMIGATPDGYKMGVIGEVENPTHIGLVAGKKYEVTYNGVKYVSVCTSVAVDTDAMLVIGAPTEETEFGIGFDFTEVPFSITGAIVDGTFGGAMVTVSDQTATSCTIAISVETETIHTIDPKFLPAAEVLVLEDYGISLQTLFAKGGGKQTIDASPLFAKMERGKRYILRGAYGEDVIEAEPGFIQYRADGSIVAVSVTIKATINNMMVTADFEIYTTYMACVVTQAAIPS